MHKILSKTLVGPHHFNSGAGNAYPSGAPEL